MCGITQAKELIARMLVIAHWGLNAHHGADVMMRQLRQNEHRKPPARNAGGAFYILLMGDSYGSTPYLLVLKDRLTHYCEIVPCDSLTSSAKRFGLPSAWDSDNGSHFKNSLMENLLDLEHLNCDILLLENQLDTQSWECLISLVQANLNQLPVKSLGGRAPIELVTGLQVPTPLHLALLPRNVQMKDKLMLIDIAVVDEELEALQESLRSMHEKVADCKERARLYQKMAKKGSAGDFVLGSRVDKRLRDNKLMERWVGPYRVTEAREYSFMIEHLITCDLFEIHGSRLKFFHNASMNVTAETRHCLGVERIQDHRYNAHTKQCELLVSWRWLHDIEYSWKALTSMIRDVPVLVKEYVKQQKDDNL
ncbi:hypothetical protein CCR75_004282 [Bremia lactucae]|uniref:Chromo domain-containing protein n=1 Tax=Bremia lactucae TaxID=4779 RepID=A0A976II30_BRELC|nr:hypothetical protein CCR75_004282 [Bremia lactucae]